MARPSVRSSQSQNNRGPRRTTNKTDLPEAGARTPVTIRQVAREAGASIATVSHVLNNTRSVSPELRERVLAAAARLDFHPSASARSLRQGHGPLIELKLASLSGSSGKLADGAIREADRCSVRLAIRLVSESASGAATSLYVQEDSPHGQKPDLREVPWRLAPADAILSFSPPGGKSDRAMARFDDSAGWLTPALEEAAACLARRLLQRGSCALGLLWLTGPEAIFQEWQFMEAAHRAMSSTLSRHGLGPGAVEVVRSDRGHCAEALECLRARGASSVIVNSARPVIPSQDIQQHWNPAPRMAFLDTDAPAGLLPDGCLATYWDWEEIGARLVRAAISRRLRHAVACQTSEGLQAGGPKRDNEPASGALPGTRIEGLFSIRQNLCRKA